jgi:hypothetical protein
MFMRQLRLYEGYSREEVHDIFSPETIFTPQSGTWGLHGIVKIPDRPNDFTFFVTYGQQQGEHKFDEGITEDGVLSWQSQPRQSLSTHQIQQLINHDELINSIYLFLRTKTAGKYTYLGKLKYLFHDSEREKPVYFQWQVLDWPIQEDVRTRMGLILQDTEKLKSETLTRKKSQLSVTQPPIFHNRGGTSTSQFRVRKNVDYSMLDAKNKRLGLAGELLILGYEKQRLNSEGREDLSSKVRHVSQIEGDGAGYDIESFSVDGKVRYIEVKTSRGSVQTAFYMSSNEVEFSRDHPENYFLYRIYEYDNKSNSGKLYIVKGKIEDVFKLTPINFRVGGS